MLQMHTTIGKIQYDPVPICSHCVYHQTFMIFAADTIEHHVNIHTRVM